MRQRKTNGFAHTRCYGNAKYLPRVAWLPGHVYTGEIIRREPTFRPLYGTGQVERHTTYIHTYTRREIENMCACSQRDKEEGSYITLKYTYIYAHRNTSSPSPPLPPLGLNHIHTGHTCILKETLPSYSYHISVLQYI